MASTDAGPGAGMASHGSIPVDLASTEKARKSQKASSQDASANDYPASLSMATTSSREYLQIKVAGSALPASSPPLDAIVLEVATHYKVSMCVIASHCDDGVSFQAQWNANFEAASEKQAWSSAVLPFFHHHVRLDLPIIIDDASRYAHLQNHALVTGTPYVRFYAAAPLVDGPGNYVGTLCIIDISPRTDFTLMDAEYLVKKAAEVTGLLKEAGHVGGA